MEIILLEKIENLGAMGDKVTVKPGFGRNYLVPKGKAKPATPENIAQTIQTILTNTKSRETMLSQLSDVTRSSNL